MKVILTILLYFTVVGQLLRLPIIDNMGIMPIDLILVVVLMFWGLDQLINKKKLIINQLFWPIVIFLAWSLISLLINIGELGLNLNESLQSLAYYLRYASYLWLVLVFSHHLHNNKNVNYWHYHLYFSATLLAILGFLQLKFFPSFADLRMNEQGWDPHIGRLLSTWFDPNFLGGYLAFILSLMGGDIWQKYHDKQWRNYTFMLLLISFLIILIALFLTYSRSAYLALLVMGTIWAILVERKLLIVGSLMILLLLTVSPRAQERVSHALVSAQALFTQTEKTLDPTSRLRLQSWQVGLKIFKENPVFGVGFNTLKVVQKKEWAFMTKSHAGSGIDSSLLTVMATTGLIGLIIYLWFWLLVIKQCWSKFKNEGNGFAMGLLAGIIGIFIHAIFVNTLFLNLFLPGLLLAIALVLNQKKRKR